MTRKKLREHRNQLACVRYFGGLDGRRPSERMIALADACGFSKGRASGQQRCHKKKTKAMRRFIARIQFFAQLTDQRGKWLSPRDFADRPHFDESIGRCTGYREVISDDGQLFYMGKSRQRYARPAHLPRAA